MRLQILQLLSHYEIRFSLTRFRAALELLQLFSLFLGGLLLQLGEVAVDSSNLVEMH